MEKLSFNDHWQFKQFNSNNFTDVELPHDAMQDENRDATAPSGPAGAYYPGNQYIYQKEFEVPVSWTNEQILLEIGGIYQKSSIELNGHILKKVTYGYRPFIVDLTPRLKSEHNILKITVDNSQSPNSRWYSGAGIYRKIWLWHGSKSGLLNQDVKVTTTAISPAKIHVSLHSEKKDWKITILDGNQIVATAQGNDCNILISNAKYWSAERPFQYLCHVQNSDDQVTVNFGVRKIEWYPGTGLSINGKVELLRGGCLHPDNGLIGAASYQESEYRRIKRLKEYGFNAIRSSHNPASAELLEACDEIGMYVIDEMWDMWYKSKNPELSNQVQHSQPILINWSSLVEIG